ncbi:MAG: phosphatase PAP2 family protein [Steroidobacteraceae bacterium]
MRWRRPLLAALLFAVLAVASMALGWDHALAHSLFFDATSGRFIGTGAGDWWARDLLHHGGRNLIRAAGLAAVCIWIASHVQPSWRALRKPAGYVALCLATSAAVVAALKFGTRMDCPRDLLEFGGTNPVLGLLDHRPAGLPAAACFPGAHAASGVSLLSLYYAMASVRGRYDSRWLLPAVIAGVSFAFAQEARGAHFLSHDLTGAAVSVIVAVLLAVLMLPLPRREPQRLQSRFSTATDLINANAGLPGANCSRDTASRVS